MVKELLKYINGDNEQKEGQSMVEWWMVSLQFVQLLSQAPPLVYTSWMVVTKALVAHTTMHSLTTKHEKRSARKIAIMQVMGVEDRRQEVVNLCLAGAAALLVRLLGAARRCCLSKRAIERVAVQTRLL